MNRHTEFEKIAREAFGLDQEWITWFMNEAFSEHDLLEEESEGRTAAIMLSSPYSIDFHGIEVPVDYISFVATARDQRGKGHMRKLMHKALKQAFLEKTPFAALIPASRPLYFIYDRMGFATTFYVEEQRYISGHQFEKGHYHDISPTFSLFSRLESLRPGTVRHSEERYQQIISDIALSDGRIVAVSDGADSEAMVFAEVGNGIKVIDLLSTDSKAAEAALAFLTEEYPEMAMIIYSYPSDNLNTLRARGMIRITNVEAALSALAQASPSTSTLIRVSDRFLPENSGTYLIDKGLCTLLSPDASKRTPDMDVTVDVLAKVLFSAPETGRLFHLPTQRPFISLMLD